MPWERAVGPRVCGRYAQNLMSTRKLILLALACGLAILAAAAAQLFLAL